MEEIWKDLKDWESDYQISDKGRIRSKIRFRKTYLGMRSYGGSLIKPLKKPNGYYVVNLTSSYPVKRRRQELVHKLVLLTFVGSRPPTYQSCHLDGKRGNNKLDNLRWDTVKNNHLDKKKHGTHLEGENHPNSKLSDLDVKICRCLYAMGNSIISIAKMYNTPYGTISKICHMQSRKNS